MGAGPFRAGIGSAAALLLGALLLIGVWPTRTAGQDCYSFFITVNGSSSNSSPTASGTFLSVSDSSWYELNVWIYDARSGSNSSAAERNGTATAPSASSVALTTAFYQSAGQPLITSDTSIALNSVQWTYNASAGVFRGRFQLDASGEHVLVLSAGNASLGASYCTVQTVSASVVRTDSFLALLEADTSSAVTASFLSGQAYDIADLHCSGRLPFLCTAVLNSSTGDAVLMTTRRWVTAVNVSAAALGLSRVQAVRFTGASTLVAIGSSGASSSNRLYYALAAGTALNRSTLVPAQLDSVLQQQLTSGGSGAPGWHRLATLQGADVTLDQFGNEGGANSLVVAYATSNVSAVALSTDRGQSFAWLPVPAAVRPAATELDCVAVSFAGPSLTLLFRTSTTHITAVYQITGQSWKSGHTFTQALFAAGNNISNNNVTATLVHSPTLSGELLAFGETLWYSADSGLYFREVRLRNADRSTGLRSSERLRQVEISRDAHVAAWTTQRRLFVGVLGAQIVYELPGTAASAAATAFVLFDATSTLRAYVPSSGGFSSTAIALYDHIAQQSQPCLFSVLLWDVPSLPVYLDRGQSSMLRLNVTGPGPVRVTSRSSNAQAVQLATNCTFALASSTTVAQLTLQEARQSALGTAALTIGLATPTGQPGWSDSCQPAGFTLPVRVGCPPRRHVRVRLDPARRSALCDRIDRGEVITYSVGADVRTGGALNGAAYDAARFGCPQRVNYGTPGFRPQFDLYDGETFVRVLDADYVLWEVNDRFDWQYNATVAEVRCRQAPFSWATLLGGQTGANRTQVALNSTFPYHSCFSADSSSSSSFSTAALYEVINGTSGLNAIAFPSVGRDGLFLFGMRVVDPEYSYCLLSTWFALDVYGGPADAAALGITTGATVGVILSIVAAVSCVFYRLQKPKLE